MGLAFAVYGSREVGVPPTSTSMSILLVCLRGRAKGDLARGLGTDSWGSRSDHLGTRLLAHLGNSGDGESYTAGQRLL